MSGSRQAWVYRDRDYVNARALLLSLNRVCHEPDCDRPAVIADHDPGDLLASADRFRWPISWGYRDPLLERALNYRRGLNVRSATRAIVDLRERDDGYGPYLSSHGRLRGGDWRSLPGGLQKSAHRGRVLRVY
jgi:hypothetical protein